MAAAKTTIEVFQGKNKLWFFRSKSKNTQTGDVSEGYTRKSSAVRAAKRWHPGTPIVLK
jgi:uncharacterized protein YegP (UPF0339 family)